VVRHLGWKDRKGAPDGVVADLEDKAEARSADANRPFEEQCPLSDREYQQKCKRCGETRSRGAHLKNVVIVFSRRPAIGSLYKDQVWLDNRGKRGPTA